MVVRSPFHVHSTAQEVVAGHDLAGRTVIVTGGASGIGLEVVRALNGAGADIVVAVRDTMRAETVLRDENLASVAIETLDLANLASVRAFAERWGDRPLDILINNAGVMQVPFGRTREGAETHVGINHLGHFLLAILLTPNFRRGGQSRLVAVSSSAHRLAPWNAGDPDWHGRPYDRHVAYGESKAANALFALAYDQRYGKDGVRAFSLMPGVIETPLMRHVPDEDRSALLARLRHVVKDPAQGASTIVWAAIGPELDGQGGLYLENCQEAEPADPNMPGLGVASHVRDIANADRLWAWSLAKVGLAAH